MTFSEFLNMGGHGFYVWTSYGVGLIFFLALYFGVKIQHKKLINQLRRQYRQQDREKARNARP